MLPEVEVTHDLGFLRSQVPRKAASGASG
jgi:hypothetical protein